MTDVTLALKQWKLPTTEHSGPLASESTLDRVGPVIQRRRVVLRPFMAIVDNGRLSGITLLRIDNSGGT